MSNTLEIISPNSKDEVPTIKNQSNQSMSQQIIQNNILSDDSLASGTVSRKWSLLSMGKEKFGLQTKFNLQDNTTSSYSKSESSEFLNLESISNEHKILKEKSKTISEINKYKNLMTVFYHWKYQKISYLHEEKGFFIWKFFIIQLTFILHISINNIKSV